MRKQYDDFTQLKPKEMSKAMSDMTYQYINPETEKPTVVPPQHYEKILDKVKELYTGEITSRQFLTIMYTQLSALKKEDEKYFQQALLCLDLGLNPKDLRINESIALTLTYDYVQEQQKFSKKDFHYLNSDFLNYYKETLEDPEIQTHAIKCSNYIEEREQKDLDSIKKQDSENYNKYHKDDHFKNNHKHDHDRER